MKCSTHRVPAGRGAGFVSSHLGKGHRFSIVWTLCGPQGRFTCNEVKSSGHSEAILNNEKPVSW